MNERSRASRHELVLDPDILRTFGTDRSAWYETTEEIEAGLEWGRRKAELLRWVRRQMGRRLTLRERRCVELYFFRGMTYREAGRATGTNPSSVYRAVQRSLRKLKRCTPPKPRKHRPRT